jgi:hypothetical protein
MAVKLQQLYSSSWGSTWLAQQDDRSRWIPADDLSRLIAADGAAEMVAHAAH